TEYDAGKATPVAGEVKDFDLLTHLERNKVPSLGQSHRLQHETDRLRDQHEIPSHFRVRHLDRPAGLDLLEELRYDAPAARQNVPEAYRGKDSRAVAIYGLNEHLGHALRHAHDAARVVGLV